VHEHNGRLLVRKNRHGHRDSVQNGIAILTVVFNNGVVACERPALEAATAKYGTLTVGGNCADLRIAVKLRRSWRPRIMDQ
jgi:hypothetical protein